MIYEYIQSLKDYKKVANGRGLRFPRNGGQLGFLMCGAPGAGKSTRAKILADELGGVHISLDAIREKLYGSADIQGNFADIERIVEETMDNNSDKPIILDATHYCVKYRNNARYQLEKRGYTVVLVVVDTSVEECIRRDSLRERHVPVDVIKELHQKYSSSIRNLAKEEFYDVVYL